MGQASCKKYDISGNLLEEVSLELKDEHQAHSQLVKDYILALRANARQWSANTKGRSESNHSGAKPHAQKGTGKARQGFLGAPQYKGGGRVHTPKPKFDQHIRINKKERQAAIRSLLIEKILSGDLVVLSSEMSKYFEVPKTKVVKSFHDALGFKKKTLFLRGEATEGKSGADMENFVLSLRNIKKSAQLIANNVNGYNLLVHEKIVVLEDALPVIQNMVRG